MKLGLKSLMLLMAMLAVTSMGLGCQQRTTTPDPEPEPQPEPQSGIVWTYSSPGEAYFPTGVKETSMLKITRTQPSEVGLNEEFAFTIVAENMSPTMGLKDVVIMEDVTGALDIVSSTPPAVDTPSGKKWELGTMLPGESKSISVRAKATDTIDISRCLMADYTPFVCVPTRVVKPALQLVKSGPSEVLICDPIKYTLTVKNNGTGRAKNVVISDTLPAGLTTATGGKSDVSITVGDLEPGETKTYAVDVKAAKTGVYENNAKVTGAGGLESTDGHTLTVRAPKLTIKSDAPKLRYLERVACHTYTVTNEGDGVAKNATLTVTMTGGSFLKATGDAQPQGASITYKLGDIAAGASKTVEVCHTATKRGMITSTAKVEAYCADAVEASGNTEVKGIPALLLEVIDLEDPIELAKNVTYEIKVTNQGTAEATNILIKATLPDGMSFVDAGGATVVDQSGQTVVFKPLGSLAPKAQVKWTVTVKATKVGDRRFAVEMTADQLDSSVNETESTNLYE